MNDLRKASIDRRKIRADNRNLDILDNDVKVVLRKISKQFIQLQGLIEEEYTMLDAFSIKRKINDLGNVIKSLRSEIENEIESKKKEGGNYV